MGIGEYQIKTEFYGLVSVTGYKPILVKQIKLWRIYKCRTQKY